MNLDLIKQSFSPTALVQMAESQVADHKQRALTRGRARVQVKGCTDCELHRWNPGGSSPVALDSPRSPSFVVVGEAPGPQEIKQGKPFVGKSGKLLRALMNDVGIDDDEDVLWCNTVSCFPNVEGEIRPPTENEQSWCRGNLMTQIEAGYTRYVLLVGAKAMNAFRSDLLITHHHGKVFVWNELYCVMGILHPAGALRSTAKREIKNKIREDLKRWGEIVWGGDSPLAYLETACIKCKGGVQMYDRDGVPYCKKHWQECKEHWRRERLRWDQKIEQLAF